MTGIDAPLIVYGRKHDIRLAHAEQAERLEHGGVRLLAQHQERGLPIADYFLWNDDFEYSTRLIRDGVGLYCPSSVVVHKTRVFGSTDADPGERLAASTRTGAPPGSGVPDPWYGDTAGFEDTPALGVEAGEVEPVDRLGRSHQ